MRKYENKKNSKNKRKTGKLISINYCWLNLMLYKVLNAIMVGD